MKNTNKFSYNIAFLLEQNSVRILMGFVLITLLLAIPMLTMNPEENASNHPGGHVYDLQNMLDRALPPRFFTNAFIVEARGGDILTQAPLWELYQNTKNLRILDTEGKLRTGSLPKQSYLASGYDADRLAPIVGIYTLADAVHEFLVNNPRFNTTLGLATDDQVKLAIHALLQAPDTQSLVLSLSSVNRKKTTKIVLGNQIDYWTSPSMIIFVAADNEKLGGGTGQIVGSTDPITRDKESFGRKVQNILRGSQSNYQLWGIAIDLGLEIDDEVSTAIPFVVATFLAVLIVVGISLRSIRVVLLTAIGLIAMIVWLKGLSNLIGLRSSTTLDFIVPIAMLSLGADFVIHAVSRYKEARNLGNDARKSFRLGMSGVLGALFLAFLTDTSAFLANTTAGIETVIGFGIGAAIAISSAFIILGINVPIALMWLDSKTLAKDFPNLQSLSRNTFKMTPFSFTVVSIARRWAIVLPVVVIITTFCGYLAIQLEPKFEIQDLLKSNSDFAISLDKIDEQFGDSGGENAIVYIEGDLTDPVALEGIQAFINQLSGNQYVAKNHLGEVTLQAEPLFLIIDQVLKSEYARKRIENASGVVISTKNNISEFQYSQRTYQWPKSAPQLKAIFDFVSTNGVPANENQNIYEIQDVRAVLFHDITGTSPDVTSIVVGIPNTVDREVVIGSRDTLEMPISKLQLLPPISRVGLTGSPYTRQAGLDATFYGLQRALPIAILLCFTIATVAMRSIRFGIVTIIPIILVVTWLYAFMRLFGFGLNFMTATIAAVSIGVGIDYAIHMTERFREELAKSTTPLAALDKAARSTGIALLASALTSIAGFSIMAIAPMPFFASYGLLTAVMILFSFTASLVVLPSLLVLVTLPKRK